MAAPRVVPLHELARWPMRLIRDRTNDHPGQKRQKRCT
jgi:hypothetical protein